MTLLEATASLLKELKLVEKTRSITGLGSLLECLHRDSGRRYIEFDAECLGSGEDYKFILSAFERLLGSELKVKSLQVDGLEKSEARQGADEGGISERVSVCLEVNGREISSGWEQTDDWITEEFFELLKECERCLKGKIVKLEVDQCYRAIYLLDETEALRLSKLFARIPTADIEL